MEWRGKMKRFFKDEKGNTLIFTAFALAGMIGFAGLVIDGGKLFLAKSQLQKAVDAGALAGADRMVEGVTDTSGFNYGDSEIEAKKIAVSNYSDSNISYEATFPENNIIQVYGEEKVSLVLMPVLGLDKIAQVVAKAQVKVGELNTIGAGVVIPIGIQLNQTLEYGAIWELNDQPGEGYKGYYNFLDFSSLDSNPPNSGANGVGYYIENGSPVPLSIGDSIDVQTGVPSKSQPIKSAINAREGYIIYVPIVEMHPTDPKKVIIVGFAAFELMADYDGHAIQAKFIKTVTPGEIGDETSDYGTYTSALIL